MSHHRKSSGLEEEEGEEGEEKEVVAVTLPGATGAAAGGGAAAQRVVVDAATAAAAAQLKGAAAERALSVQMLAALLQRTLQKTALPAALIGVPPAHAACTTACYSRVLEGAAVALESRCFQKSGTGTGTAVLPALYFERVRALLALLSEVASAHEQVWSNAQKGKATGAGPAAAATAAAGGSGLQCFGQLEQEHMLKLLQALAEAAGKLRRSVLGAAASASATASPTAASLAVPSSTSDWTAAEKEQLQAVAVPLANALTGLRGVAAFKQQ